MFSAVIGQREVAYSVKDMADCPRGASRKARIITSVVVLQIDRKGITQETARLPGSSFKSRRASVSTGLIRSSTVSGVR